MTWVVTPATASWDGESRWAATEADVFEDPGSDPVVRFTVVATHVPRGTDVLEWASESVPLPPEAEPRLPSVQDSGRCRYHWDYETGGAATFVKHGQSWQWDLTTIAGNPAVVRGLCSQVDAVIIMGEQAFVLSLGKRTVIAFNQQPPPDWNLFQAIADTLDPEP
jgi:hypothetical protein